MLRIYICPLRFAIMLLEELTADDVASVLEAYDKHFVADYRLIVDNPEIILTQLRQGWDWSDMLF